VRWVSISFATRAPCSISLCQTFGVSQPFQHRRCLVPADWFYEWPVVNGEKQARAFSLKNNSQFAFAGGWDRWKDKETGEVLESFAIVAVEPNEWMAKYHDRMGVIIEPKNYQRWEPGEIHSLPFDLLRPAVRQRTMASSTLRCCQLIHSRLCCSNPFRTVCIHRNGREGLNRARTHVRPQAAQTFRFDRRPSGRITTV
jgi:hypothetical protein